MKKAFIVGIKNQWDSPNLDFFKIGFHKCEYCDVFIIAILGFSLDIGFTTVE